MVGEVPYAEEPSSVDDSFGFDGGSLSSSLGDILRARREIEEVIDAEIKESLVSHTPIDDMKKLVQDAVRQAMHRESTETLRVSFDGQELPPSRSLKPPPSDKRTSSLVLAPPRHLLTANLQSSISELKERRPIAAKALADAEQAVDGLYFQARQAERELRADYQAQADFLKSWWSVHEGVLQSSLSTMREELEMIDRLVQGASLIQSEAKREEGTLPVQEDPLFAIESLLSEVDYLLSKPVTTISLPEAPPFEARARHETLSRALSMHVLLEAKDKVIQKLGRELAAANKRLVQLERVAQRSETMVPKGRMSQSPILSDQPGARVSFSEPYEPICKGSDELDDLVARFAEEVEERGLDLKVILDMYDEDGDGVVDRVQFAEAVRSACQSLSNMQIDKLMVACDRSGHGDLKVEDIVNKLG